MDKLPVDLLITQVLNEMSLNDLPWIFVDQFITNIGYNTFVCVCVCAHTQLSRGRVLMEI